MTVRDGYSDWLDIERYSDNPVFNTKAVVQQTGISAPTLRAWERRYALLSPERAGNDYRLYSERDIALIRWLKERVDEGMAISQAIALYRHMQEEFQRLQEDRQSKVEQNTASFHIALPSQSEQATEPPTGEVEKPTETSNGKPGHLFENLFQITKTGNIPDSYRTVYNMHAVQKHLIDEFMVMNETAAGLLMASMLAIYPVEQVCTDLIVPTMWEIGQLWEEGKVTVSVEHFASGFFRGLLTNLLHVTSGPESGPLVIVCCAPGEPHELAPLMLALFLRRLGVRVAYLGQSIETAGLLQTIKQLAPTMICVSLTISAYLPGLIELARIVHEMPHPRPLFAFGGQVFVHYTQLIEQVPGGIYLEGDLKDATAQLRQMISEQAV